MGQVFTPNLGVKGIRGWCLKYVDDAGNAPTRRATARMAFNAESSVGRIRGADSPVGVWVVGFLDFTRGQYTAEGHVFFMKHLGGGRYEIRDSEVGAGARSPYGSLNELLGWFGAYGPKFIGWSTDCDGRKYVSEGDFVVDKITKEQENAISIAVTDGYPGVGYDYRFSGTELTSVRLDQMFKFWFDQSINEPYGVRNRLHGAEKALAETRDELEVLRKQLADRPEDTSKEEAKLTALRKALKDIIKD